MKLKVTMCIALLAVLVGCTPDNIEIELYTSDIQKASSESVIEVPLTATFSIMGKDEDGNLLKAAAVAKRYLGEKAEFKTSKGNWGDMMLVKCFIPMGTPNSLETFLVSKHRPFALTIENSTVSLGTTLHLEKLNQDLNGISTMLDVELPANSTVMRFVGDMQEGPEITAFGVFVDRQPELIFRKKIERRVSVEVDYKGGDGSVYSELEPSFKVSF